MSATCSTTFTCDICGDVLEAKQGYNKSASLARNLKWQHGNKSNKTLCPRCGAVGYSLSPTGKIQAPSW
jgi:hypothetical protein